MTLPKIPIIIIALAVVTVTSCARRTEPETALSEIAAAVNERRCGDAVEFLSERTRYSLDKLRETPQRPHESIPLEEYYCSKFTFEDCKLREMSLKNSETASATVTMPCGRTQDSFLPGFPSMFLKYEPRDWDLVREDGRWRIVLPTVIRIVDVRERENEMRERALRQREEYLKRRSQEGSPDR